MKELFIELQLMRLEELISIHTMNADIYWRGEMAALKRFLTKHGKAKEVEALVYKHEHGWRSIRRDNWNPVCR